MRRAPAVVAAVVLIACAAHAADRAALIAAIHAACSADRDRLCADVPAEGTGRCFKEHWGELTPTCRDVITSARAAMREQSARRATTI